MIRSIEVLPALKSHLYKLHRYQRMKYQQQLLLMATLEGVKCPYTSTSSKTNTSNKCTKLQGDPTKVKKKKSSKLRKFLLNPYK